MANEKRLDLINKWDVVNKLIQLENNYNFYKDVWDAQTLYRRICELEIGIGKTPTVDAAEVVHGKWLYDSGSERYFCSACNEYALSATTNEQVADYDWEENLVYHIEVITKEFWTDYCPHCGAKMDGDGNGNL